MAAARRGEPGRRAAAACAPGRRAAGFRRASFRTAAEANAVTIFSSTIGAFEYVGDGAPLVASALTLSVDGGAALRHELVRSVAAGKDGTGWAPAPQMRCPAIYGGLDFLLP